ncbi:MAG: hypothetical protein WC326_12570 [Candidatus Delongbacteria bacterium]
MRFGDFVWIGLALGSTLSAGAAAPAPVPQADVLVVFESARTLLDSLESDILLQRLSPVGQPLWNAPRPLARTQGVRCTAPALCGDGQGGAFAIWSEAPMGESIAVVTTGEAQVARRSTRLQHLDGEGRPEWPAPKVLGDSTAFLDRPALQEDGVGGVWAAWQRESPDFGATLRVQHLNGAGQPLCAPLLVDPSSSGESEVCLLSDGSEGLIALFGYQSGMAGAQRFSPAGQPLWHDAESAILYPFGYSSSLSELAAVPDGRGGCFAVGRESVDGGPFEGSSHLVAQHLTVDGTLRWGEDGAPLKISSSAEACATPAGVADYSGGVLLAWATGLGSSEDGESWIEVLRLDSAGTPLWPTGIVEAFHTDWQIARPRLLPDGAGGAYLVAEADSSWEGESRLHLQHILPDGTPAWNGLGGRVLPTRSGWRDKDPRFIAQGTGLLLVHSTGAGVFAESDLQAVGVDFQGNPVGGACAVTDTPEWEGRFSVLRLPPR